MLYFKYSDAKCHAEIMFFKGNKAKNILLYKYSTNQKLCFGKVTFLTGGLWELCMYWVCNLCPKFYLRQISWLKDTFLTEIAGFMESCLHDDIPHLLEAQLSRQYHSSSTLWPSFLGDPQTHGMLCWRTGLFCRLSLCLWCLGCCMNCPYEV